MRSKQTKMCEKTNKQHDKEGNKSSVDKNALTATTKINWKNKKQKTKNKKQKTKKMCDKKPLWFYKNEHQTTQKSKTK